MLIVPVHHHGKELPPTFMMTCDVASCFARPCRSSTKPDHCPFLLLSIPNNNFASSIIKASNHQLLFFIFKYYSIEYHQQQIQILKALRTTKITSSPTTHSINTTISNSSCSSSQLSSRSSQQLPLPSPPSLAILLNPRLVMPAM